MALEQPLVSVILPVYNGETYIEDAIASIHRQGDTPIEIIVIDDGSTDGTAEIVQDVPDVHYVYQANSGPAAARNRGIERARGEVVAFIDADDWWADDKLAVQLAYLDEHPSVEIVHGLTQFMQRTDPPDGAVTFEPTLEPFIFPNLGSALFRASVFDRVGLLDASLHYSEDVDWYMRARELGVPRQVVNHVVHFYRVHETNMTLDRQPHELNIIRVLKKSLDRRRREQTENTVNSVSSRQHEAG